MEFRVFYTDNNLIYSVDKNNNFVVEENDERDIANYRYFESMKGYEKTKESLLAFKDDFSTWIIELNKKGIDYIKYYNHLYATYYTFLKYSTNNLNKAIEGGLKGIDNIDKNEFLYFERCYNAGLMSIDENQINQTMK